MRGETKNIKEGNVTDKNWCYCVRKGLGNTDDINVIEVLYELRYKY